MTKPAWFKGEQGEIADRLHPQPAHDYLSTACLHGVHEHCQCDTSIHGDPKEPGKCKWCEARCRCTCHPWAARPMSDCTCPVQDVPGHGPVAPWPHPDCPQHHPQTDGGTPAAGADRAPDLSSGDGVEVPGGRTSPAASEAPTPSPPSIRQAVWEVLDDHLDPAPGGDWAPIIIDLASLIERQPSPLALHRERAVEALHRYEHYECTVDPCPKLLLAQERADAVLATAVDLDAALADQRERIAQAIETLPRFNRAVDFRTYVPRADVISHRAGDVMTPQERIAKLREQIAEATPGPWRTEAVKRLDGPDENRVTHGRAWTQVACGVADDSDETETDGPWLVKPDAEHIARWDPVAASKVLALIEAVIAEADARWESDRVACLHGSLRIALAVLDQLDGGERDG